MVTVVLFWFFPRAVNGGFVCDVAEITTTKKGYQHPLTKTGYRKTILHDKEKGGMEKTETSFVQKTGVYYLKHIETGSFGKIPLSKT